MFHYVEEVANVPYHMQKELIEAEIIERDKKRKVKIKIHAYGTARNFSRMEPILRKAGVMRMATIGSSTIRLLKAKEAVNITLRDFKKEPEILLDKRIKIGIIGKVIMIRNMFGGATDMSKKWFSKREISGGGVLIDNGVHAVDLFRFLFGEVKNISARIATFTQDINVEDTARLLLEMENGSFGTIDLSWSIPYPQSFYLEVYGSEGSIMVGWDTLRYRNREMKEWIEEKEKFNAEEKAFTREINHFVDCIKGKETPTVNGVDGLRALEVIETAYKSSKEKNWGDSVLLSASSWGESKKGGRNWTKRSSAVEYRGRVRSKEYVQR